MIDSLIQRLCDHAQGQPKRPAVLEVGLMGQERVLTWSQLHAASHRFSERVLSAQDSAAGAVLVSSETGLEMLVSILGCIWAGQPVLPVAANVPPGELVRLAGRARVVLAIGDRETCRALRSDVQECWSIDGVELDVTSDGPTELPHGSGSLLLQSSGTTGMPKIVRRCEQAIARIGRNCSRAVGLDREDIILVCIPLYHSYGIDMGVSAAIWTGCQTVLQRRFDPSAARSSLATRGVTILPGVPLMLDVLSRPSSGEAKAPLLRKAFSAGSQLPRRVFDQFLETYGIPLGQIYGTTELGAVLFSDPKVKGFTPAKAGRPMDDVEVRVLEVDGPRADSPLGIATEGQVAISTLSMFSEYVDTTTPVTENGFLTTGDLGFLDREGFLTLTGRVNLLVDIGGLKVNPLEVEAILEKHPGVREAAVVPIEYSETGNRLKAFLVPEAEQSPSVDEMHRFARDNLIHYKQPRNYEFRRELPRSSAGKILRSKLRELARHQRARP